MISFPRKKVEFLSKEAISRVLQAEAEATRIREEANAEASARLEACERDCAAKAERDTAAATAEMKTRTEAVRRRADALIEQSREEAENSVETMKSAARDRMREAVRHIEWELTDI